MSNFDVIKDAEGKEYLMFDSSELYDDNQMGDKPEDFELLIKLGEGSFGQVFKVRSKLNNKVYAMKKLNIIELKRNSEKVYQLTLNETSFLKGLSHPHIIKYYKYFIEKDFLYIIIEFVENGDMDGFIEANKKFKKHFPEEVLWNIFLQCMDALSYIHSKGVIHRDIKPANLLMDNNMSIKLGDFGVSAFKNNDENNQYLNATYIKEEEKMKYHGTVVGTPLYMAKEVIEENEYDQKVDVYSMGVSFFEMCYFHIPKKIRKEQINGQIIFKFIKIHSKEDKLLNYSKELLDIINLMLEEDKDKRKSSEEIYNTIKNEYSRKYMKNSSICAIMRCLISFQNLTNELLQISYHLNKTKPISQAYIQCIQLNNSSNKEEWTKSVNYFRQLLSSKNPRLEGSKEIDPRLIFAFLLKHMHKELNNPFYSQNKNNQYLIITKEEAKTSKVEMMLKFFNDFLPKINSLISINFLGLMKLTNFCMKCRIKTYSFSSYFFVTIDLEKYLKSNNINRLDIVNYFRYQNNSMNWRDIFCSKCLNKTRHSCYKQFYSLPNLLIISIQRGIMNTIKTPVDIVENLNLSENVEIRFKNKQFILVGVLGRNDNSGNERFFSVVKANEVKKWLYCDEIKKEKIELSSNYLSNGDILMLFYRSIG